MPFRLSKEVSPEAFLEGYKSEFEKQLIEIDLPKEGIVVYHMEQKKGQEGQFRTKFEIPPKENVGIKIMG